MVKFRILALGSVAFMLSCGEPEPPPSTASPQVPIAPMTPVAAAVSLGVTPFAVDDAGFPHLLRGGLAAPRMPAADAATSARMQVAKLAPVWGVRDATLPALETVGEVNMPGGTIVRLRQLIDGLPVDRDAGGEVQVMVGGNGELVAASGKLIAS